MELIQKLESREASGEEYTCEPPRRLPASVSQYLCHRCGRAWRGAEPDLSGYRGDEEVEIARWTRSPAENFTA
jgi:hypothetical protein